MRNGDGTFGLTFVGFAFDDTGKFLAMQHIRVAVQVDDSQDGFTGPFKTDFIGADGQVLASTGGTVQGRRIQSKHPHSVRCGAGRSRPTGQLSPGRSST